MVGKRQDAVITGKLRNSVGGKAFPNDYNWVCPVCQKECRKFEEYCSYCEHNEMIERRGK